MKLVRLKLLSPFRGLHEGFELRFAERELDDSLEPYCFVGLNGSGKSNVIESLAEIFFYLERYGRGEVRDTKKTIEGDAQSFGFEIEYAYDMHRGLEIMGSLPGLRSDYDKVTVGYTVRMVKPKAGNLEVSILEEGHNYSKPKRVKDRRAWVQALLPLRIIGYSSGANELLSGPFLKMEMAYHEQFIRRVSLPSQPGVKDVDNVTLDRLFFMDYESNKFVLLSNFIFRRSKRRAWSDLEQLCGAVRITDLISFSITYRTPIARDIPRALPSQITEGLQKLSKCATCQTTYRERGHEVRRFDFFVDSESRRAFDEQFNGSAFELFKALYSMRLMNASLLRRRLRNTIANAKAGTNLSNLLPRHGSDVLLFHIDNIHFKKEGFAEPVLYKHLSDGEHQLMHILGTMALMDDSGSLFLLDEPETHFNPEWRARFVSMLNKSVGKAPDGVVRQQEVLITSHSPFIVSDCQPDRVFRFQRKEGNPAEVECQSAKEIKFNTFGASVETITSELFGYTSSFGEKAKDRIEALRDELRNEVKDAQTIIADAYRELGDSAEKVYLLKEAMDKRDNEQSKS